MRGDDHKNVDAFVTANLRPVPTASHGHYARVVAAIRGRSRPAVWRRVAFVAVFLLVVFGWRQMLSKQNAMETRKSTVIEGQIIDTYLAAIGELPVLDAQVGDGWFLLLDESDPEDIIPSPI